MEDQDMESVLHLTYELSRLPVFLTKLTSDQLTEYLADKHDFVTFDAIEGTNVCALRFCYGLDAKPTFDSSRVVKQHFIFDGR